MHQIKASAGSGKTYTLTRQYLRLLTDSQGDGRKRAPHAACARGGGKHAGGLGDILAITFTNAAVNEIRKRVIESLKKISLGKTQMEGVDQDKATACLEALLDNMDEMNVRTIDSLLHQIVRSSALSLGLNPDFEPVFKAPQAIKPYLDKYMEEAFLGDKEKKEAIRAAVKNFLDHSKQGDSKPDPLILGQGLAGELENLLSDALLRQYASRADGAEERSPLERPPYMMDKTLPYSDLQDIEAFKASCHANILKSGRELKAMVDAHNAKPKNKAIKCNGALKQFFASLGEGEEPDNFSFLENPFLKNVDARSHKNFDHAPFAAKYAEIADSYSSFCACSEHMKYARILSLGAEVVEEYYKDMAQASNLPSILIPVLAERALSLDDGVCDALCRLGTRLTHFMLDEFQDTSMKQWAGIYSLIREALARNGSLTWVGDIKQSIFMWREACPQLFDAISEDKELSCMVEKVKTENLPCNWRSAPNIVEFNNRLFSTLNTDAVGAILNSINSGIGKNPEICGRIRSAFADCVQKASKTGDFAGMLTVKALDEKEFNEEFKRELLAFIQARVIEKKELAPSDIMILVRKNEHASELAAVLAAENIPVITENSLLLNGETLIREAVALLEFMADPDNDQALLTLLCGDAFLGHPELSLFERADFFRMAFEKGDKSLYKHLKDTHPDICAKLLDPFYKNSTLLPPYDVVREWFRNMELERRYPEKRIFLNSFLEYLHRAEADSYNSISAFLDHWHQEGLESKAIMPEGVEAIKIMTIHKAKGLQAPVVIVPLKNKNLQTRSNQSDKRIQHEEEGLIMNVRLLKSFPAEYERAMMRETQEILNMLYVAFTRAENELHIFTSSPQKSASQKQPEAAAKGLLENMMIHAGMAFPFRQGEPWVNAAWQKVASLEAEETGEPESGWEDGESAAFPWISRLKIARNTLFADGDMAQRRGTFMHFCLENMRLTGDAEADARKAFDFGLSYSGLELEEEEKQGVLEALAWFASQKEAAEWLKRGWPEQPMLDAQGNELRMDLLVPQDWGALVIDYKSGRMTEKNKEQMRAYLNTLKNSGEFGDKLCGLLVYLDERKFLPVSLEGEMAPTDQCPETPFV